MSGNDIFISYRRTDTGGHARSLFNELRRRFDGKRIFFDRHSIDPGEVFTARLDEEARQCKALLAFIGPDWLDATNETGARRLEVPEDCVRGEVGLALRLGKKIIPVLFDSTPMPTPNRLPEDLKGLATHNALTLQGTTAEYDTSVEQLVQLLAQVPGMPTPTTRLEESGRRFFGVSEDSLSDHFTGRESELAALDRALPRADDTVKAMPLAIHGMGGCGKTQLALKLALDRQDDYAAIWWLRGERSDLLEADFEAVCSECQIPREERQPPFVDAIRWLGRQPRVLLVLDNVDSPEQIRPYLKPFKERRELGKHHVLITSRHPNWAGIATPLEVHTWTLEQGIAFLVSRLPGEGLEDIRAVVERLGALPLALEQAAAYIFKRIPVASYRHLLESVDTSRELLDRGEPVTGHRRTVAKTLQLSIERLSPATVDLLRLCAGMSADPIPLELFTKHPELLPAALENAARKHLYWYETVAELWRFSLASRDAFTSRGKTIDSLQFHRLTQAVASALLGQPNDDRIRFDILAAALREDSKDPMTSLLGLRLLPHFRHVLELVQSSTSVEIDAHLAVEEVDRATRLASHAGLVDEAATFAEIAHAFADARLNAEDPARCSTLISLANALWNKGDPARAIERRGQALTLQRETLGDEHPDTLTSALDLAEMQLAYGNVSDALTLQRDVIRKRTEILGEEHPDTLLALSNFAEALVAADSLAGAQAIHEEVLKIRRRVLGPEHRGTVNSMINLAATFKRRNNFAAARTLLEPAVDISRRVLGAEDENTLIAMEHLALIVQSQGDVALARDLYARVLEAHYRARGPEHYETTLSARNLFINLRWHLHDRVAAEEVFKKHLAWLLDAEPDTLWPSQRETRDCLLELAKPPDEQ